MRVHKSHKPRCAPRRVLLSPGWGDVGRAWALSLGQAREETPELSGPGPCGWDLSTSVSV